MQFNHHYLYVAAAVFAALLTANPVWAKKKQKIGPSYAWTVIEPLGLRQAAPIDTLYIDYSRQSVPSEVTSAWACTGNLGAEGTDRIWFGHQRTSEFFFRDALSAWLPSVANTKFYNTRIPMTLLSFNTGGGKETTQDRLKADFSGNINHRAQVGAMLDYIYSKGSYANQSTKDLIWGLNGSYIGDRFEFQGFYNHYNMLNKENGGITDVLYITDPAQLQGGVSSIDSKAIPTNLTNAHSRVVGGELMLNSRYKVGYWHTDSIVNDTTEYRTYIPVTSFVWTLNYRHGRHVFTDNAPGETQQFFENTYLNPSKTYDKTTYYALTNTLGISLLEGFHKYAKFGLAAYVTHQLRSYTQMADTVGGMLANPLMPLPEGVAMMPGKVTQNLAWAGAQLTKQRGSLLTFEATGQIGFLGDAAGDVSIDANVASRFRLWRDSVNVGAYVSFHNEHAPFLLNQYVSNHFAWRNDFGKERTLKVGGTLTLPRTGTRINVGVENIQNHIYFGPDFLPVQHGGSVQIFAAALQQNLAVRALHWDNRVTYQTSGNQNVIALPKLAVYSNLYVLFHIATLKVQFGVDCDYYTRYYAPNYQPATMTFASQNKVKIGNYPFMNLYANMRLSKARFYVAMTHINQGWFNKEYFSLPNYPLNPRRFQMGISVDFAN